MKQKYWYVIFGIGVGMLLMSAALQAEQGWNQKESPLPEGAVRTDTLVSFTDSFREAAESYWREDREYAACVEMRTVVLPEEDEAQIQLVFSRMNHVALGTEDRSTMPICNEKAVIHSHPSSGCSTQIWTGDIPAAEAWYREGGVAYLVQCAPDRIEVYTRETGLNGKVFTI